MFKESFRKINFRRITMSEPLTEQQQRILDFIIKRIKEQGYPPSVRDIAHHIGVKSTNGVANHLKALEKKGYIKRESIISRAIRLVNQTAGVEVPVVGHVTAGKPILAVENIEGALMLDVNVVASENSFLLKVEGMSMKDAGILDGDYVLVRQQQTAESGEIVVAMINSEATVKRFRRRGNLMFLEPENPQFDPILITRDMDFQIIGKVTAVLRILDGMVLVNRKN
jgi:repressor LexA